MTRLRRVLGPVVALVLMAGCATTSSSEQPQQGTSGPTSPGSSSSAPPSPGAPAPQATSSGLRPPTLARSPRDLATRLIAAERTTRDRDAGEAEVAQAAFDAQVLYRQLARREAWLRPVGRLLPRWLRTTTRAQVAARRDFRSMHRSLSTNLPAWRIVAPASAADLRAFYRQGQRRFGVPWEVLAAVNLVETGFGRIRGTSVAGARGPMQFMPATWAAYGRGDIDDPRDAILAAARYLAANGGGRGRVAQALYAYNRHPAYVRGVQAYARILQERPEAFRGLYHWQIIYLSARGDVWLPVGYDRDRPLPVDRYLRRHPDRLLDRRTD